MDYSYVITYRENNHTRKENLKFILRWVLSMEIDLEIILVEQDTTQKVDTTSLPSNCKLIFVRNDGLFNRAWGLNVGFRHASGKAIAFGDNDLVVDREILMDSFTLCSDESDYDAIKPFNTVIDMTEKDSKTVLRSKQPLDSLKFQGKKVRIGVSFCSGLVVFRRKAYEKLGGYDERFVGWGGEDDAMSRFKIPLLKKAFFVEAEAYHLWHERSKDDSYLQPNYLNNLKLLMEYQNYSKDDTLKLCEKSSKAFGKKIRKRQTKSVHRKLIIGLGTGRCGTKSLSVLLSLQPNTVVPHEYQVTPLPWVFSQEAIEKKIKSLDMINGDVGFYYVNYIDFIAKLYPKAYFICLQRSRKEVIDSYMRKTQRRNHWINHDGKTWQPDPKWDAAYPKFNTCNKALAIGMYYDLYYEKIFSLSLKYPKNLKVFNMDCLNNERGIRNILGFCGFLPGEMNIIINKHNTQT